MYVLVGYATRHGSTVRIAERIAIALVEHGHRVGVHPLGPTTSAEGYDAYVLGSPLYNGSWLPEAIAFARLNRSVLTSRPVWLFSVGSFSDTHRVLGRIIATRTPRERAALVRHLRPRGVRLFTGVVEQSYWPPIGQIIYRALGGRYGDRRNWDEIDAWAEEVARELTPNG